MKASDLSRANEVAYELRGLYGSRDEWDSVQMIAVSGFCEDDGWTDRVEIDVTPELLVSVKTSITSRIAELESELRAMGVDDPASLSAGDDEDEDEDEDLEEAA